MEKEQKYLCTEKFYGRQKLHKHFISLLIGGTSVWTCSYIGELCNDRKFKCENKPCIVLILILRRVSF